MKNLTLILSTAVALIGIGNVSAADLPVKATPYIAGAPAFSWTGCYVGGNAGGVNDRTRYHKGYDGAKGLPAAAFAQVDPSALAAFTAYETYDLSGNKGAFAGGVQAGCNYQTGNWVVGVEGDFNGTTAKHSVATSIAPMIFFAPPGSPLNGMGDFNGRTDTIANRLNWLSTVRGRVGWAPAGAELLLYATAGAAFGDLSSSTTTVGPPSLVPAVAGFTYFGSGSGVQAGFVVGAGLEYAFAKNWSAKAEYLYVQLANLSYDEFRTNGTNSGFTATIRPRYDIVRLGINYHFSPAAVVTKY